MTDEKQQQMERQRQWLDAVEKERHIGFGLLGEIMVMDLQRFTKNMQVILGTIQKLARAMYHLQGGNTTQVELQMRQQNAIGAQAQTQAQAQQQQPDVTSL